MWGKKLVKVQVSKLEIKVAAINEDTGSFARHIY